VEDDKDEPKTKGADESNNKAEEEMPPPEFKPNFGLSGALAKDTETGNVYKGVVLKFKEPPEARAPNTQWRLYVFKPKPKGSGGAKDDDNDLVETLHISKQSAYLLGRNADIADIPLLHPSLSSQHAVLQYRAVPVPSDEIGAPPRLSCQPYIMDLESTNGTFLNGVRIDAARYYQLRRGDVLTFGASTREYVLLTENTTSVN
jgi:smad nuclear-interacting protein 1